MIIKNLKTNRLEWVNKPCIIPMHIINDNSVEIPMTWGDEGEYNLSDTYSLSYCLESTGKKETLLEFTGSKLGGAVSHTFNHFFETSPIERFEEYEPHFYIKKTLQPFVTAYAYYLLDKKLFKKEQKENPDKTVVYKRVIQSFKNTRKGRLAKNNLECFMMTYFYILNASNWSNLEIVDTINSTSTVNKEFAQMMVESIDDRVKRQLMNINEFSDDKEYFDFLMKKGTLLLKEVA